VEVPIHYRGFTIDDLFVVGYGMDLDQQFRGLRHVAVYESADAGSGVAGA
jgi:hypoxanthine phosphoribosyltransferase